MAGLWSFRRGKVNIWAVGAAALALRGGEVLSTFSSVDLVSGRRLMKIFCGVQ